MTIIDTYIDLNKARKWFLLFCFFQLIAWTIQPTWSMFNIPFDSAEGIAWGNMWLWGYEQQPPLAAWLSALFTNLGHAPTWPLYLLSQICVVICFWAMWRLALKILPPWHAFIAIAVLSGIQFYNLATPQFDPDTLMLPTWALTCLLFYNALVEQKWWQWLLVGIFAGIAMLTKYEAGILFAVMLVVLLATKEGRRSFIKPTFYAALLLGLLIWLPNLIWLVQHQFVAVTYAVAGLDINAHTGLPIYLNIFYQAIRFFFEMLGTALPALILLIPFVRNPKTNLNIKTFQWRFVLIMGLGPTVFVMLFALLTNSHIHALWGTPFLSFVGILAVAGLRPTITKKSLNVFAALIIIVGIAILSLRTIQLVYYPYIFKQPAAYNFPGKEIALTATKKWHDLYPQKISYVGGDHDYVIMVSTYSPDHPRPNYFDPEHTSPWINQADFLKQGAVFVTGLSDISTAHPFYKTILERYPQIQKQYFMNFPYQHATNLQPLKVWIGILPPQGK